MRGALINGESDQQIDVADRGLNYGDGVFETIQIRNGVALLWQQHLARMRHGAARLKIPFNDTTAALFFSDFAVLVNQFSGTGVLKLVLTRGNAERGYKIVDNPVTRITTLSSMPDLADLQCDGVSVLLCQTQLARQPLLAGIKHLNRLEQVMARSEWSHNGITEGIVCDTDGFVIEGCMSNLFWIKGNTLFTPTLSHSGVRGVIRNLLLELCDKEQLLSISEGFYKIQDLLNADEIFVTNSAFDVLAVTEIHLDQSSVNSGLSGQVFKFGAKTRALNSLLQQHYLKEVSI